MSEEHKNCFVVDGALALPYQYYAGTIGSKFIVSIRDDKKILGQRNQATGQVFVPPRRVDLETLEPLGEDWVEIGPGGEITNFTVVRYKRDYQPLEPPYVLAMIKLDGADTPLTHVVNGLDPDQVQVGMRVTAVFSDEPKNDVTEIAFFKPEAG